MEIVNSLFVIRWFFDEFVMTFEYLADQYHLGIVLKLINL